MMDEIIAPSTDAGLLERPRPTGFVRQARVTLAVVCSGAVLFLWWFLASDRSAGKIFGLYSNQRFILLILTSYVLGWIIYYLIDRQPLSAKTANCGLTTASLLILFGLIELPALLGWINYGEVFVPTEKALNKPWENPSHQLDRELIHIRRPRQRLVGETPGDLVHWLGIPTDRRYKFDIECDNNGFRNDHEIQQAPVVLIGDSFLEWALVSKSELISDRLGRMLQVEVANLGQPAYGPQQELIVLRRYGLSLQPKVVLWFFFEGNDLLDVARYERTIQNVDEIMKERTSIKERSFANNALLVLAGLTSPRPSDDEARRRSGRFLKGQGEEDSTLYFAYPGAPLSEQDLASLRTAQSCFLQAQQLCANAGAKLAFVYVPTKYRVYRDFCEFPDDGYGKSWVINDLPSMLESWCKTEALPYLDLTPSLKESASRGELVYFSDDGHWNGRGHEVVTQAIASFLETSEAFKDYNLKSSIVMKRTEQSRR
jgi:hypothetical protein